ERGVLERDDGCGECRGGQQPHDVTVGVVGGGGDGPSPGDRRDAVHECGSVRCHGLKPRRPERHKKLPPSGAPQRRPSAKQAQAVLLLSDYGQPRQFCTCTGVTSTPFETLVHACIRLSLPGGYLVVTCYMPPRSSDLRSPNFHVGTGQRVVPCPMALPMLSP